MMATMIGKIKWVSLVSSVIITVRAMVIRATPAKKPWHRRRRKRGREKKLETPNL